MYQCFRFTRRIFDPDSVGGVTAGKVPDRHLPIITNTAENIMRIVKSSTLEAGVSNLLASQMRRLLLEWEPSRSSLGPPLFWMMRFLSRTRLRPHQSCRHPQVTKPSFAWVYAVNILVPDLLPALADVDVQESEEFSIWICNEFFTRTDDLLKKAKQRNLNHAQADWATLHENLVTEYFLTAYHNVPLMYFCYAKFVK